MTYMPLFADLAGQPCLVVGGGEVAYRKATQLLDAGATVIVATPVLCGRFSPLAASEQVSVVTGIFRPELLNDVILVIAATSDPAVNAAVATAARARRVLCNVVDDGPASSFILPAVIQRDPVTIAISTAGHAPVLARWIKARIEDWLPARIGALARFAGSWRVQVRNKLATITARRRFWETVFGGDIAEDVLAGREPEARRSMTGALEAAARGQDGQRGEAWLVGAGPGDPDLITLRGKQLLARADVVLYDRLVAPELLQFARREAELIDVGKRPGESATQRSTNELLVEHVRAGRRVCRLKGGDAFVFGRGGEEIDALNAAGLRYQIVPGITAALACAAHAGIPLTHREMAHAVLLGSAQLADEDDDLNWPALARGSQTLALYMSVRRLDEVSAKLIAHGRASATPCALVENGATPRQRVLLTNLASLGKDARHHSIRAPAILFVGATAGLAARNAWFATDGLIDARGDWQPAVAATMLR